MKMVFSHCFSSRFLFSVQLLDVFGDPEAGRQLLRQHIIASPLTLGDLANSTQFFVLEGTTADLFYKVRELANLYV
jgi:hypothetical protein